MESKAKYTEKLTSGFVDPYAVAEQQYFQFEGKPHVLVVLKPELQLRNSIRQFYVDAKEFSKGIDDKLIALNGDVSKWEKYLSSVEEQLDAMSAQFDRYPVNGREAFVLKEALKIVFHRSFAGRRRSRSGGPRRRRRLS